jgi:enterochelin esterase-like enzyme
LRSHRLRPKPLAVVGLLALSVACSGLSREPWELEPLPPDGVFVTRLVAEPPLFLDRVRFRSAELDEPRFFLALVPAGEEPIRDVFILNHGWRDRPEDLLRHLKVDQVYARLLAAGKVRRAVVVLPDIRFSSYFRRHSERFPFNQSLELVATEVASLVSSRYHIPQDRDHWSIAGFSFGGYVALDVARRYSGRFGAASVWSAFFDRDWTFWPAHPPPAGRLDPRGRGKQTIVVPGPVPRLLLGCGTGDRFYETMLDLHRRLTELGIEHEWQTAPGGHTWSYWSSVLEPMLLFHLGTGGGGAP